MKITEQKEQIQAGKRKYEKPLLIELTSAGTEGKFFASPTEFSTFGNSSGPS
jgi:hypothetical protein